MPLKYRVPGTNDFALVQAEGSNSDIPVGDFMNKITTPTAGNLIVQTSDGNSADAGVSPNSFAKKPTSITDGNLVSMDSSGNLVNAGAALNSKLSISGGTMTGALTLSGDPTSNLQAATKQYVDNKNVTVEVASKTTLGVVKVGDSLTIDANGVLNVKGATVDPDTVPIGTIVYSTSSPGEGFLQCDGSYVPSSLYPELVSKLSKNILNTSSLVKYNTTQNPGTLSNAVFLDGFLYFFSITLNKIFKINISNSTVTLISTTFNRNYTYYSSTYTMESLDNSSPIVLAIVEGRIILIQKIDSDLRLKFYLSTSSLTSTSFAFNAIYPYLKDSYIYNTDIYFVAGVNSSNYIKIVYKAGGSRTGSNLDTIELDLSDNTILSRNSYFTFVSGGVDYSNSLVYSGKISYSNNTILSINRDADTSSNIKYIVIKAGEDTTTIISEQFKDPNLSNNSYKDDPIYHEYSFFNDNYSNCIPVESDTHILFRVIIKDRKVSMLLTTQRAFPIAYDLDLIVPDTSVTFSNSILYIESQALWIIFIGNGFLFTRNIEDSHSWGYLDTTKYFDLITKDGGIWYSSSTNYLYVYGVKVNNSFAMYKLNMNTLFKYSDTGAWLPSLENNGTQAWIKA